MEDISEVVARIVERVGARLAEISASVGAQADRTNMETVLGDSFDISPSNEKDAGSDGGMPLPASLGEVTSANNPLRRRDLEAPTISSRTIRNSRIVADAALRCPQITPCGQGNRCRAIDCPELTKPAAMGNRCPDITASGQAESRRCGSLLHRRAPTMGGIDLTKPPVFLADQYDLARERAERDILSSHAGGDTISSGSVGMTSQQITQRGDMSSRDHNPSHVRNGNRACQTVFPSMCAPSGPSQFAVDQTVEADETHFAANVGNLTTECRSVTTGDNARPDRVLDFFQGRSPRINRRQRLNDPALKRRQMPRALAVRDLFDGGVKDQHGDTSHTMPCTAIQSDTLTTWHSPDAGTGWANMEPET